MADNSKMILNLFSGMQDALFLGDRFDQGDFVSFMQPGQFLSTNLKEVDGTDDMAIQSEVANILVDSSYVNKYADITYGNSRELPGSVSQVYEDIMKHEALPNAPLSQDQINEISDLQGWIASNEPNYDMYQGYYQDAVDAYEAEAAKQSPNPARLQSLSQKEDHAFSQWQTLGLKDLYENKVGRLVYLTAEDPLGFWSRLQLRLQQHQKQAPHMGQYYRTFLVPSISSWNTAGWATFSRKISEQDSYSYSKQTSWSAGISAGWGLFSFGGGASGSSNYQYRQSSVSQVSLKFDYLRVRIFRPWLVPDVFGYKFWTWKKTFGGQMVSDGGNLAVTPPVRPVGRMPILPEYLIVVRNLELSGAFSAEESSWYQSQISGGVSVGWGPFSLSGSYSESTTTQHAHASFDGVTFKIEQPQIIARTGIMLDRSPDPDQSLSWQGDQWFPHSDRNLLRLLRNTRAADHARSAEREVLMEANAATGEAKNQPVFSTAVGSRWYDEQRRWHEHFLKPRQEVPLNGGEDVYRESTEVL
jgi:hypothetical protein